MVHRWNIAVDSRLSADVCLVWEVPCLHSSVVWCRDAGCRKLELCQLADSCFPAIVCDPYWCCSCLCSLAVSTILLFDRRLCILRVVVFFVVVALPRFAVHQEGHLADQNVAFSYDVGKIRAGCLVWMYVVLCLIVFGCQYQYNRLPGKDSSLKWPIMCPVAR